MNFNLLDNENIYSYTLKESRSVATNWLSSLENLINDNSKRGSWSADKRYRRVSNYYKMVPSWSTASSPLPSSVGARTPQIHGRSQCSLTCSYFTLFQFAFLTA